MASQSEHLARALSELKLLQESGVTAIRSTMLSRVTRQRLLSNGFIKEVIKGWYISTMPTMTDGDSTPWYTAFWPFCSQYLTARFNTEWSLSPEQSLLIHAGNYTVPKQIMARAPKAANNLTPLLYGTSLVDVKAPLDKLLLTQVSGLNCYTRAAALVFSGPQVFNNNYVDVKALLAQFQDPSELLSVLLPEGKSIVAGRIAGAFEDIGRSDIADEIVDVFAMTGVRLTVTSPFSSVVNSRYQPITDIRYTSPAAIRIATLWDSMRETVLDIFESAEKQRDFNQQKYLASLDAVYSSDAYHSLSIEGYQVSQALIDKIQNGEWDPAKNKSDSDHRNALAAYGYWKAFNCVVKSITTLFSGKDLGETIKRDLPTWYRSLFLPNVAAGLLSATDLAGYRSNQVYISGSRHTPMSSQAVREAMPVLFDLIDHETNTTVAAVLGHFMLGYIHPYLDGNGRTARFLMNAIFASGGHDWIIIPTDKREDYMSALERASVDLDIAPFAELIFYLQQNKPDSLQDQDGTNGPK